MAVSELLQGLSLHVASGAWRSTPSHDLSFKSFGLREGHVDGRASGAWRAPIATLLTRPLETPVQSAGCRRSTSLIALPQATINADHTNDTSQRSLRRCKQVARGCMSETAQRGSHLFDRLLDLLGYCVQSGSSWRRVCAQLWSCYSDTHNVRHMAVAHQPPNTSHPGRVPGDRTAIMCRAAERERSGECSAFAAPSAAPSAHSLPLCSMQIWSVWRSVPQLRF